MESLHGPTPQPAIIVIPYHVMSLIDKLFDPGGPLYNGANVDG